MARVRGVSNTKKKIYLILANYGLSENDQFSKIMNKQLRMLPIDQQPLEPDRAEGYVTKEYIEQEWCPYSKDSAGSHRKLYLGTEKKKDPLIEQKKHFRNETLYRLSRKPEALKELKNIFSEEDKIMLNGKEYGFYHSIYYLTTQFEKDKMRLIQLRGATSQLFEAIKHKEETGSFAQSLPNMALIYHSIQFIKKEIEESEEYKEYLNKEETMSKRFSSNLNKEIEPNLARIEALAFADFTPKEYNSWKESIIKEDKRFKRVFEKIKGSENCTKDKEASAVKSGAWYNSDHILA